MGYYDHYRGSRRKRRSRIRIVLLLLLLLIVGGLAALYFLQDAAIFTADGFRFPFFQKDENSPPAENPGEDSDPPPLVIQDPEGNPLPEEPSAPENPPETPPEPVQPVQRTAALLTDGQALLAPGSTLAQQAQDVGYRQLALEVKSADGQSLVDDGVEQGLSPQSAGFVQALGELDAPKVAVFSALRDNVRPRRVYRGSALHTASGATWLDFDYIAWFDPAAPEALNSLKAMIAACEDAGFDQIVLQNFQYPVRGRLDLLSYGTEETRREDLTRLASQLRELTDLPLGLVLTEGTAAGEADPVSGQDPAALAQYFDVLYLPSADLKVDLSPLEAAVDGSGCRVGLWVPAGEQLPEDTDRDFIMVQQSNP